MSQRGPDLPQASTLRDVQTAAHPNPKGATRYRETASQNPNPKVRHSLLEIRNDSSELRACQESVASLV